MRALVLALLVLLLAPVAPAGAAAIGIGDQKREMFSDPQFGALGITRARFVVPFDVLQRPTDEKALDDWLTAAREAGVTPLLSFGHSRIDRKALPTPRELQITFRLLRQRYPWATEWVTWNEANHCSQPLCHKPELAARYFDALERSCRACGIVAADVLDQPNMVDWIRAFRKRSRETPALWGLHNYLDVNRKRTSGTEKLLRAVPGRIWLTETGGIVRRRNVQKITFPESAAHAGSATRWLFERILPLSPRISRAYIYQWQSVTDDNWDSGLLTPGGRPRAAYRELVAELARRRRAA